MKRLITFTDQNMTIAADICVKSALANNVDEAKIYKPVDIDPHFFDRNIEIFKQSRGYGHWLWKPYFINRELRAMKDGDYLIYADAGVEFVNNINHVTDRMKQDVWLFGNMWQHEHWCKRDIIEAVFEGKECSFDKQVQASVIVIRKTQKSALFVNEWLRLCQVPGLIDDAPSKAVNHPEFKENRHDQAILATLAYRDDVKLHWWPAIYNAGNFTYNKTGYGDDYPVLFHHHRMRNDQFSAADDLNRHMQNYFNRKYKTEISYTELLK